MVPQIRELFGTVVAQHHPRPRRVLEVGTWPITTLLNLPGLEHAEERVGVDLEHEHQGAGWSIVKANAHQLPKEWHQRFDLIMCNAMLEHDPQFWQTLGEVRRVAAVGALVIYGAPGFVEGVPETFAVHRHPVDCYRFGEDAVRHAWFAAGYKDIQHRAVLHPPRIVGWATRVRD
jgi:ubiquinone/menaquinone biosynthesis C-methylase UbiE